VFLIFCKLQIKLNCSCDSRKRVVMQMDKKWKKKVKWGVRERDTLRREWKVLIDIYVTTIKSQLQEPRCKRHLKSLNFPRSLMWLNVEHLTCLQSEYATVDKWRRSDHSNDGKNYSLCSHKKNCMKHVVNDDCKSFIEWEKWSEFSKLKSMQVRVLM
jgi:hypothetical protein